MLAGNDGTVGVHLLSSQYGGKFDRGVTAVRDTLWVVGASFAYVEYRPSLGQA